MVTQAELRLALPALKASVACAQSWLCQRSKLRLATLKAGFASVQSCFATLKLNATEGSFNRWLASFEREACRTLNVNEVNLEQEAVAWSRKRS